MTPAPYRYHPPPNIPEDDPDACIQKTRGRPWRGLYGLCTHGSVGSAGILSPSVSKKRRMLSSPHSTAETTASNHKLTTTDSHLVAALRARRRSRPGARLSAPDALPDPLDVSDSTVKLNSVTASEDRDHTSEDHVTALRRMTAMGDAQVRPSSPSPLNKPPTPGGEHFPTITVALRSMCGLLPCRDLLRPLNPCKPSAGIRRC